MAIPEAGKDGNMVAELGEFDLAAEIAAARSLKPWPSGIHAKTLFKKDDFRVVLISMETGAHMKEHHVDGTSSVQVLEGAIRYSTLGRTHTLHPGTLLTLAASIPHDVEAIDQSVFLLTISWPDTRRLAALQHRGYGT
ncbi:MAG TPA: cupin domain-containing protein [Acidobacteriaceae bacterium]|nr:cupin domain-containing protein [Acidobacteriaceae bacterium]